MSANQLKEIITGLLVHTTGINLYKIDNCDDEHRIINGSGVESLFRKSRLRHDGVSYRVS
jgi:hypothetical protein